MRTEYCIKCKQNKKDSLFFPYDEENREKICNKCKDRIEFARRVFSIK